MKFTLFNLFSIFGTAFAFSNPPFHTSARPFMPAWAAGSDQLFFAEEGSTGTKDANRSNNPDSQSRSVYDRLGFPEDKVAIGLDPKEILQWLGNRDDIIDKFKNDNKGMTESQVIDEVDKFVMDAEMVMAFIAFEKRKSDPRNLKIEAEANLADPNTWGIYGTWIAGGVGFAYVKNVIIEPKYRSGEWDEIHITLPFTEKIGSVAGNVVDSMDSNASIDSITSAADSISSAF